MSEGREYHIHAVERSLRLLEVLAGRPEASLDELSAELGSPKGSVFRHLKVLERGGYVRQTAVTRRYALGTRLIFLGWAARTHLELREVATPIMARLRDELDESVHLGVVSGAEVVVVASFLTIGPHVSAADVGYRARAHVTALGKSILAFGPDWLTDQMVAVRGLPQNTPNSIDTLERLRQELERTRRRGYAVNDEEEALGLRGIAAPVRDETGTAIGAVSVAGTVARIGPERAHAIGRRLIAVTDEVSRAFGWRGPLRRASAT